MPYNVLSVIIRQTRDSLTPVGSAQRSPSLTIASFITLFDDCGESRTKIKSHQRDAEARNRVCGEGETLSSSSAVLRFSGWNETQQRRLEDTVLYSTSTRSPTFQKYATVSFLRLHVAGDTKNTRHGPVE